MRRAIAPFILLLIVLAGCETEKDPVDEPLDPSFHLTDGFCLVKDSRVVLNHYDIDYYDYSAHLIYLKSPGVFEQEFKYKDAGTIYADSTRIYDLSFVSHAASYIPQGPVIWFPSIFSPEYTVRIDMAWINDPMGEDANDPREDPRIVEALEKYGQFRHGLQVEIASVRYNSPENVVLELELRNEDSVNYYYFDPEKMGMGLYHYVTNGLYLSDMETGQSYHHLINGTQPDPWDWLELEGMSLLESNSSVILTITYDHFDELPPGNYTAYFQFPAPNGRVPREDLDRENGRIWLGELQLYGEVVIE